MIADPDQGTVPHTSRMPDPPRGPIGDVEQIDVSHGDEEPWREHVSRQATVDAAHPSFDPCMDRRNVDRRGWTGSRLPHVPRVAMLGYLSVTPEQLHRYPCSQSGRVHP